MQIDDALRRFTVQLEADGRSPHTIGQYRRHVAALARWLDDTGRDGHVEALDHEDVAAFLASPEARRRPDGGIKKAGSMNSLRGSLKGFFGYLHRAGTIPSDPTRLVRRALCGRPLPRTISEADQEKLLAAIDHARDHLLFNLMLRTGIRLGSALALDASDLDLERGEIVLRHAKGDREERVYLPKGIQGEVATFLTGIASGPVFRGRGERRLTSRHAQRRLAQWAKRAGIERAFSPHGLRHSFATNLYRRTGDILLVQRALRHRSITSTLVYAHVEEAKVREAIEA